MSPLLGPKGTQRPCLLLGLKAREVTPPSLGLIDTEAVPLPLGSKNKETTLIHRDWKSHRDHVFFTVNKRHREATPTSVGLTDRGHTSSTGTK